MDLFTTVEGSRVSCLTNVTVLHWAQQKQCFGKWNLKSSRCVFVWDWMVYLFVLELWWWDLISFCSWKCSERFSDRCKWSRQTPEVSQENRCDRRHWFCFSNVQSACQEVSLFVFEDNEVVIEMIVTGRSPTMRHVCRHVDKREFHTWWIICWICLMSAVSALPIAPLQWQDD